MRAGMVLSTLALMLSVSAVAGEPIKAEAGVRSPARTVIPAPMPRPEQWPHPGP